MSRPVLVALMGLPGAGKTAVAARLCAATGAARVSRDELRARWSGPLGYAEGDKARLFSAVLDAAERELAAGRDVALDGMPFSRVAERDAVRALGRRAGAPVVLALLDLDVAEARRRVAAAGAHAAADRSPTLVDEVAARFAAPDGDVLVLDARRPPEVLAAELAGAMAAARATRRS